MEWQQLEYFRAVAKTEHFRKAAEQLAVTQPALSRAIAKLEEELGVTLFDRIGRSVKLNAFGHLFLQRVENGRNEIAMGIEEINHMKNPHTETVSLAFLQTMGTTFLPEIMSRFTKQYTKVEFQLFQSRTFDSIDLLLKREVELSLISKFAGHSEILWHRLMDEELFAYVPADHRLASRKSIALDELADDSFIAFKKGMGMREVTNRIFEEAGFIPNIKFEGEDVPTLAGLVSVGLGVAIIPAFHGISTDKIKRISISKPHCHREIGIAWLDGKWLTPSADLFRQFVIHMYKTIDR